MRWQDWVTVAAGVVVALSTIWVTPGGLSMLLMIGLGALLVIAGLINLAMPGLDWMEWVHGAIGVLLFISPWAGMYATHMGAAWFSWVCGGVAVIAAAWELLPVRGGSHHDMAHSHG
ncbi:SPW repeat protein [Planctomonas sp. JC2975]|nr:SPW repeat protein [Planctomonas sp. JC2975]